MQGRDELQSPRSHTNVDFNSLLMKNKSPLQCSHTVRDEYTRGSTLIVLTMSEPLHYDDNGITGQFCCHSEVVFKCFRDKKLPAQTSLSVSFHILLVSSTCFLIYILFIIALLFYLSICSFLLFLANCIESHKTAKNSRTI